MVLFNQVSVSVSDTPLFPIPIESSIVNRQSSIRQSPSRKSQVISRQSYTVVKLESESPRSLPRSHMMVSHLSFFSLLSVDLIPSSPSDQPSAISRQPNLQTSNFKQIHIPMPTYRRRLDRQSHRRWRSHSHSHRHMRVSYTRGVR
jgi:hypothetical protein